MVDTRSPEDRAILDRPFSETEEARHREMLQDLKEVCYIGEEGDMAVKTTTKKQAFRMFKLRIKGDVGEYEAKEMKIEDVTLGQAHVSSDEEMLENSEHYWSVFYKPQQGTRYVKVYVYRV